MIPNKNLEDLRQDYVLIMSQIFGDLEGGLENICKNNSDKEYDIPRGFYPSIYAQIKLISSKVSSKYSDSINTILKNILNSYKELYKISNKSLANLDSAISAIKEEKGLSQEQADAINPYLKISQTNFKKNFSFKADIIADQINSTAKYIDNKEIRKELLKIVYKIEDTQRGVAMLIQNYCLLCDAIISGSDDSLN